MSSHFSRALCKLKNSFGTKCAKRVLLIGLDASGKTTILYKLKLGEIVTTIPTIVLNVETIEYKNIAFSFWDISGMQYLNRPSTYTFYEIYDGIDIIIFVVDSNDRERIDESSGADCTAKEMLYSILNIDKLRDAVLLVLANKQDLPNAMSVNEVTERLGLNQLRNRKWYIQSTSATTGDGLYEGLDWLVLQMKSKMKDDQKRSKENAKVHRENIEREKWDRLRKVNKKKSVLLISGWMRSAVTKINLFTSISADITKLVHHFYQDPSEHHAEYPFYGECGPSKCENLLMRFVNRRHDDPNYMEDDDTFIRFIEANGKFPSEMYGDDDVQFEWLVYKKEDIEWMKHYDFMRMIWIFQTKYDRRNGMKQIWKYTPFNTTKTYFWAQSIYFGLKNSSSEGTLRLLSSDFEYLLIMNPHLAQEYEHLMERYYSESLLAVIDEEKKEEMVLPDLLPPPSIMTDIARLKVEKAKEQQTKSNNMESKENSFAENEDDNLFIKSFELRTFKCWSGHRSFLRVIWCYLKQFDGEKGCDEKIRSEWKLFRGDAFHETIMCFWIHMVRYWRALFTEHSEDTGKVKCTFNSFLIFCVKHKNRCKMLDENWWNQYYSESVMYRKGFHGLDASQQMVFPDKNPLPQLKLSRSSPKKRI